MRLLALALVLSASAMALAQKEPEIPEVDVAEVYRRGNAVTIMGEGPRGAADEAFIQAVAPPETDAHMWYVTVIKEESCEFCQHLVSDFQRAPELLAFVAAREPYKAWAHFNVYDAKDKTQEWRIKPYRVRNVPTLIVQPPRDGSWGSPRTVVFYHTGYDGDSKKLAMELSSAVRKYAVKMAERGYPKQPIKLREESENHPAEPATSISPSGGAGQDDLGQNDSIGVDPPYPVPPRVDPFNPQPQYPPHPYYPIYPNQPNVQIPPQPPPQPQPTTPQVEPDRPRLLDRIFTPTNLLLLLMIGLKAFEMYAIKSPSKVDDSIVAILKELIPQLQRPQSVQQRSQDQSPRS